MSKKSKPAGLKLYSFLMLFAFLIAGMGIAKADIVTVAQQAIRYNENPRVDFTPSASGVLTVTLKPETGYSGVSYGPNGDTQILYLSNGSAVPSITNNGQDVGAPFLNNVTEATFNVTGGTAYYINLPYFEGTVIATMDTDSSGGGTVDPDPDPDPDDPTPGPGGDSQIQLDVEYTFQPLTDYTFVPDFTGTLYVKIDQWFTWDQEGGECCFLFTSPGGSNGVTVVSKLDGELYDHEGQIYQFNVVAGKTYYVHWDSWSPLVATFTKSIDDNGGGGGGDTDPDPDPVDPTPGGFTPDGPVLQLPVGDGTSITLTWDNASNWWVYTATQNDVLTCTVKNGMIPDNNYLYDENGKTVPLASSKQDALTPGYYTEFTWNIEGGKKYYFHNTDTNQDGKVLEFTLASGVVPESDIILDVPFNNPASANPQNYCFIPEFTGTVYMKTNTFSIYNNEAGNPSTIFFKSPDGQNGVTIVERIDGEDYDIGGWIFKFEVEVGTPYYVYYDEAITVTFTRKIDKEEEIEPNPDTPEGWSDMRFDITYNTSNRPYNLFFQPSTDGQLTVVQSGSIDPMLFTTEECKESDYANCTGTSSGSNPIEMYFSLQAGVKYYYQSNSVTSVSFSWKAADVSSMPQIQENQDYTLSMGGAVHVFYPPKDGTLEVRTHNEFYPLENYFLFSDAGHGNLLPLYTTKEIANGSDAGRYYYFQVSEGVPCYLYQDHKNRETFTFKMLDNPMVPQLTMVYPQAGSGFDASSYDTSINVEFAPQDVTYGDVTLTYTEDATGQEKTITVTNVSFSGGQIHIGLPSYCYLDPETNITSGISGIKAETDVIYVIKNVRIDGTPVTSISNEIAGFKYISVDAQGNFTIKFSTGSPAKMTNSTWPSTFKGYWEYGAQDAIATITFDQDLDESSKVEVNVIEGAQSAGKEPGENDESFAVAPSSIKISGNTLTIDFSGQKFNSDTGTITVQVSGLYGANGILVKYGDELTLFQQLPFDLSSVIPDEIFVMVGDLGDAEWSPNGVDYRQFITWGDYGTELNFTIKVEPVGDFNKNVKPDAGSQEDMPDWLWKQMEALEGHDYEVDAYYLDPKVSGEIDEFGQTMLYNFNILYGCSGTYKITISCNSDNVVLQGNTEQTVNILPSIQHQFNYTLNDQDYKNDGLNINLYQMQNIGGELTILWEREEFTTEKLKNAVLLIPGLYCADVYYYYDGMNNRKAVKAQAASNAPQGYELVENGIIDLSGMPEDGGQLNLYIEKNGVHSGMGESANYAITITPSDNVPTAVEGIESDNDAEVEYYDLNGLKVNADRLHKGIYIVKKGNKTSKVIL